MIRPSDDLGRTKFANCKWVIAVYDVCDATSLDMAIELLKIASEHGAETVLFGTNLQFIFRINNFELKKLVLSFVLFLGNPQVECSCFFY